MKLSRQKRGPGVVYCIHCGRRIRPEYSYCIYCGNSTASNPKCRPDEKKQTAMLDALRREMDTIADTAPGISDSGLDDAFRTIHGKLVNIYDDLEQEKSLLQRKNVRSLIEIYLPGILQVLKKYIDLQNEAGMEEKLAETRGSFRSVLDSLDASLDQLQEELRGEDILDMEVNLEVLNSFLHRI